MICVTGLPSKSLKWALHVCTARNNDIVILSFQGALCGLMNREGLLVPSFFKKFWCALCYFSIRSWGFIKLFCLPSHSSGRSSLAMDTEPPKIFILPSLDMFLAASLLLMHLNPLLSVCPIGCLNSKHVPCGHIHFVLQWGPGACSSLLCSRLTSQNCPEPDVELLVG